MGRSLLQKVWEMHSVDVLPSGQTQLLIGLHLIHEVTSPQAFAMLREKELPVAYPECTCATVDHIIPTDNNQRPFADTLAEKMIEALESNTDQNQIPYYGPGSGHQGVIHVIGPELGLTQPGMTIACGDSHTSTHGAFGALAFGIGTSQVRDVLATQTLALAPLKLRRIEVNGTLGVGVTAKDVIMHIIRKLGVNGGVGYAYEYAGEVIEAMTMEERMTVCNMSIEGGARAGYINPDEKTFAYLMGRDKAPAAEDWEKAVTFWRSVASDPDAQYDDRVVFDGAGIEPTVTWGINPGQAVGISESTPDPDTLEGAAQQSVAEALEHMKFAANMPVKGQKIDVCFIGSCTNGRYSDLLAASKIAKGRKVAAGVKAIVVPGSEEIARQAEENGLAAIFEEAGFEWRLAGCSMCLAMNPDKLEGDQLSASSSNRNFKGRQGSPTGRTMLMSPAMVAAAAVTGEVTDVRELLG